MNFGSLRYLVAAAETGTFREAAAQCGVSQPTLSAQLAKLEDELDQLLLERGRRGVRLTEAGRQAVEHARAILASADRLREACRSCGEPLAGELRLGVIPTAGPYLMPTVLPAIRKAHPNTELYLQEEVTDQLLIHLRSSGLTAAVLSPPFDERGLATETLVDEPFYAIVPANHALARRSALSRDDLADARLLLLKHGHCLREQTAAFCRGAQGQSAPAGDGFQASSVESLRQMVAAGVGCSILPAMAVRGRYAKMAGVKVVALEAPAPTRRLVLAWRQTHPHFGALRELARLMAAQLQSG